MLTHNDDIRAPTHLPRTAPHHRRCRTFRRHAAPRCVVQAVVARTRTFRAVGLFIARSTWFIVPRRCAADTRAPTAIPTCRATPSPGSCTRSSFLPLPLFADRAGHCDATSAPLDSLSPLPLFSYSWHVLHHSLPSSLPASRRNRHRLLLAFLTGKNATPHPVPVTGLGHFAGRADDGRKN